MILKVLWNNDFQIGPISLDARCSQTTEFSVRNFIYLSVKYQSMRHIFKIRSLYYIIINIVVFLNKLLNFLYYKFIKVGCDR